MPAILEQMVDDSFRELAADGRRVVAIEPIPVFESDPLTCLWAQRRPISAPSLPCFPRWRNSSIEAPLRAGRSLRASIWMVLRAHDYQSATRCSGAILSGGTATISQPIFAATLGPSVNEYLTQSGVFGDTRGRRLTTFPRLGADFSVSRCLDVPWVCTEYLSRCRVHSAG